MRHKKRYTVLLPPNPNFIANLSQTLTLTRGRGAAKFFPDTVLLYKRLLHTSQKIHFQF